MSSSRWWAILAVLASANAGWGQSQIWGELKAGKYGVGFRSLYQMDPARAYDPEYPVPGRAVTKKPRPIFLAIWYPAPPLQDKAMVYRDYFRAVSVDSPVPEFAQRLRKFTRDMACQYMLGKDYEKLSDDERVSWDELLATPVFATMNVSPAAGKFPVVIHHPGLKGTFDDNSVACEYLASHGYVVLSSAYQSADSSSLNIDGDLATSQEDLSFLLRYAATLPFADITHVAAIGHSYGAQAMLAWRARANSPVDAVVFLDSTAEYRPLAESAQFLAALERNRNATAPVLMFADKRRNPQFDTFDPYLRYGERYEATLDGMDHNDFVSQGASRKDEPVRRKYEAVCDLVRRFLDGYLKGDGEALKSLNVPPPDSLLQVTFKAARMVPPTSAQVVKMYSSDAPGDIAALEAMVKQNDSDLPVDAAVLLLEGGHKLEGVSLLQWAAPLLPRSADLRRALGEALLIVGDKAGSRKAFEKALELLPDDVTLDAGQKARTRKAVEDGFKALLK